MATCIVGADVALLCVEVWSEVGEACETCESWEPRLDRPLTPLRWYAASECWLWSMCGGALARLMPSGLLGVTTLRRSSPCGLRSIREA